MKICIDCKKAKPIDFFHLKEGGTRRQPFCNQCFKLRYYMKNLNDLDIPKLYKEESKKKRDKVDYYFWTAVRWNMGLTKDAPAPTEYSRVKSLFMYLLHKTWRQIPKSKESLEWFVDPTYREARKQICVFAGIDHDWLQEQLQKIYGHLIKKLG